MNWSKKILLFVAASASAQAFGVHIIPDDPTVKLMIPVTPFANMASGYQATNPGFKAILKDARGNVLAEGPLTMNAVIDGYSDDASSGSAYGRLVLSVALTIVKDNALDATGPQAGRLSICKTASASSTTCEKLGGNIHPERPFQWLDKGVTYEAAGDAIKVTRFSGSTGEGGTATQLALAVYHPAYAFAAPGKAFKDFQSPLVLDLNRDGTLALTDVWDDGNPVAFDIDGDGIKSRTGWVAPEDGLLALDVNHDGKINSGRELFGDHTEAQAGTKPYPNGFLALAALDRNDDGVISSADPVFGQLRVWQDFNQDGESQADELSALKEKDISRLNLGYAPTQSASGPLTVFDNEVRYQGSYTSQDGHHQLMADVWFKQRRRAGLSDEAKAELDQRPEPVAPTADYSMKVTNRRPVAEVLDFAGARRLAESSSYVTNALQAGTRVLFSASYGIGGEAGQGRGVLVERDGGLYYKQLANPTSQLLLPPGLPFSDGQGGVSLWEIRSYLDLINRVALAGSYGAQLGDSPVYGGVTANLVDFRAGTAGGNVAYRDALELLLARGNERGGRTDVAVYYAKNIGPVALEFRETGSPSGTFKVYLGDAAD